MLESDSFVLSPGTLLGIHAALFEGVFKKEWVGSFRVENISKKEPVLDGRSVMYANWQSLRDIVSCDFEEERRYRYPRISDDKAIDHFCDFISRV